LFALKPILQFLVTLLILALIPSTEAKAAILLVFWILSFWPLRAFELAQFAIINVIFVFSNYGALKNGVFEFSHQDILLMPWNELFMWGFYCIFAQRTLKLKNLSHTHFKSAVAYAVVFAISFSVIRDEVTLAGFLAALLLAAAFIFQNGQAWRNRQDWLCVALFTLMGAAIEGLGIERGFWHYPGARFFALPLWGPLMWANIGMIVSRLYPVLQDRLTRPANC